MPKDWELGVLCDGHGKALCTVVTSFQGSPYPCNGAWEKKDEWRGGSMGVHHWTPHLPGGLVAHQCGGHYALGERWEGVGALWWLSSASVPTQSRLSGRGALRCSGGMKASFPDFAPCKVTLTPGRNQNVPLFVQHVSRLFVTPLFCLFRKYGEGRFSTRAILSFIDGFVSELFKPGVWFQKTVLWDGLTQSKQGTLLAAQASFLPVAISCVSTCGSYCAWGKAPGLSEQSVEGWCTLEGSSPSTFLEGWSGAWHSQPALGMVGTREILEQPLERQSPQWLTLLSFCG